MTGRFLPRRTFRDDLRALIRCLCFDSWDALLAFIIDNLDIQAPDTG